MPDPKFFWKNFVEPWTPVIIRGAAQGTDAMKHLLYWSVGFRSLNALDIEFAVVDADGNWDSQYGKNYPVTFPNFRL